MYPPTTLLFTLFLPPSSYLPSLMFLCLTKRTLISAPLYWQSPLLDTLFSGRSWWLVSSHLSGLCYNVISLERISQTNLSKIAFFCHSVAFFSICIAMITSWCLFIVWFPPLLSHILHKNRNLLFCNCLSSVPRKMLAHSRHVINIRVNKTIGQWAHGILGWLKVPLKWANVLSKHSVL